MIDLKRVLPCLKATTSADETGPSLAFAQEDTPVARSFARDLAVTYVVGEGDAFALVRWRDLSAAKIDLDTLHENALANLRLEVATKLVLRAEGEMVGVLLDGRLDASTLLLDELWQKDGAIAKTIPTPIVACAPTRDALGVTSATSAAGVEYLRALATKPARGDRALSRHLLVRDDRGWQRWE